MAKLKAGKWEYTEAELQRQVKVAIARGKLAAATQPHAVEASYDRKTKRVVIQLNNGGVFSFPADLIKELQNATAKDIAALELSPQGTGLFWTALDAQYSVAGLLGGIFGTRAWMSEIGKKGGRSTSSAKTEASRLNGQKGGRPKAARVATIGTKAGQPKRHPQKKGTQAA